MKKIIGAVLLFFILLSPSFAYNPTNSDIKLLKKIYIKIDKIYEKNPSTIDKLYKKLGVIKYKLKKKPKVLYIVSELEKYIEIKIDTKKSKYKVLSVSDGDTVTIDYKGERKKLRLIGVDAPESFTSRFGYKECFGDESSIYLKERLEGKFISLEFDKNKIETDRYGRLLVYIILDDKNINAQLI